MNARRAISEAAGPAAQHVAFNRDASFFSVALASGFAVFRTDSCEAYLEQDLPGSIGAAVMLGNSQVVGLTGGEGAHAHHEARKLVLWDTVRRAETAAITSRTRIVNVALTNVYIAIVNELGVALYRHQPQLEKLASYDTASNPLGLCCVGERIAVFPGRTAGHIQVIDLESRTVSIIPAHSSPLRALALSPDDNVVASASANGTLVRVYTTSTCSRLAELRRGMSPASIYSIGISPSSNRLAVTSDSSTLHIFDLPNPERDSTQSSDAEAGSSGWIGNVQKWGALARIPFAPRVFTDVYSFASTQFDPGSEPSDAHSAPDATPKVPKGLVGWLDDETIVVISAGQDARYERFALVEKDGRVGCARVGWSRFLRPN